ncbi:SAM-dependent methyltransferase [Acidianus ambivalens]|nr:SAM-dependent methyltransferase [Acidianus ambivalens]
MRKIYAVGISPSPDLISCKAVELIEKAPVVLIYDTDFPFELEEIIKNKRVIKLKPGFKDPNVIEENIRTLKSIDADWGVFLEIGDPSIRNPLFYHILGGSEDFEIEVIPSISSVTAVFSRLGIHVRHFCMLGSEEEDLLNNLIDKCDLFVIVNIHKEHAGIFKRLKEHGYDVTFIENCCNEKEKITHEYTGSTYWIIAIAKKDLPERTL